jgi:hypothetical protein
MMWGNLKRKMNEVRIPEVVPIHHQTAAPQCACLMLMQEHYNSRHREVNAGAKEVHHVRDQQRRDGGRHLDQQVGGPPVKEASVH